MPAADRFPPGRVRSARSREVLAIFLAGLPWWIKRPLGRWLLGWSVAPTARIGFSVIGAERVVLGDGARIGHLTVVRGIDELVLGAHALIGALNWVGGVGTRRGSHFPHQPGRRPALHLGPHSAITSRHLLDCCDLVTIGAFATVAGAFSQVISHGIDVETNRQTTGPVSVGAYCYVGTGAILLKSSALPDYSVLGAASLLNAVHTQTHRLYAGVPARPIKPISPDAGYFTRTRGHVA